MDDFDVLVVGGGCAGLWTAYRLSSVGMRVALVEQGEELAPGPSTRNGGYIHGGGFHAAVIDDEDEAFQVAERCRSGLSELLRIAPEAVVPGTGSVHLLAKSAALAERAEDRWTRLDLDFRLCSISELVGPFPGFDISQVSLAAKVSDRSVDYRILYHALAHRARTLGCTIHTGFRFHRPTRSLVSQDAQLSVSTQRIVYCTGVQSSTLLDDLSFGGETEFSLWKSHVFTGPRVYSEGFMYLDPGEVSVMPQLSHSIICRSQDDIPIKRINYDLDGDVVSAFEDKLHQATSAFRGVAIQAHACLKPSMIASGTKGGKRSVGSTLRRISADEWLALPGKATEAPIMATELLHALFDESPLRGVSDRPGDSVIVA